MEKKYRIDTEENKKFLGELRKELLDFGHQFPSPQGSSYYLGDDGTPWKERSRETWITSRMAHVYSIGTILGHPGSGELTDAALKGLRGELHDKVNGGWYPGVTAEGNYLADKQCYAHAFVILAASSALLAGRNGAKELLEEALDLFEKRFWEEEKGLSVDTWNTEFTVLEEYRGLNANMHTVEAFLAAADATGREMYRARAGRIIDHVLEWASGNEWRIPEHFTRNWEPAPEYNRECPADPFKPYGATPGHGIEWARLITQWAMSAHSKGTSAADGCAAAEKTSAGDEYMTAAEKSSAGDEYMTAAEKSSAGDERMTVVENPSAIDKYVSAAEHLYQRAIEDAWNRDGAPGLVYTTDWEGNPVIHDRMHWTLAEAINTSAVLYRVTKNERYADDYAQFLKYLDETVLDHVNGSWFHQMNEKGEVTGTVWPGKSDIYHAFQSALIPYCRPDVSVASAVYRDKKGE